MAILRYIISSFLLLSLVSCFEDFDPKIDVSPVLCINSLIKAGVPVDVKVTRSFLYTDTDYNDRYVTDAVVNIYADGERVDAHYLPQEGDLIRIEVESEKYGIASAEVKVPHAVPVKSVKLTPSVINNWFPGDGTMRGGVEYNLNSQIEIDGILVEFDFTATELSKILMIDSAKLKRLRSMDGNVYHLWWFQNEKLANCIYPDEMIKDFGDNEIESSEFDFLDSHLKYVKIWHYIKRQQELTGDDMQQVLATWRDYIRMAEKAKMNVHNERIWKPKDLKAAHDEVVMILQKGEMEKEAKNLEKEWPKVNGNLPKLKKFEYEDKDFAILAPESILDIVREGRILQHCVHTCEFYFDRIGKDESYLFFLRRADHKDIPWYTLEVEPNGNIRQKRTTGDRQNSDLEVAVKFLKKWQKVFVKRLTAEEKKLGEKADQARIAEYAKLRKDGNKIWRGPLAGKLLADVLEADFMAAAF